MTRAEVVPFELPSGPLSIPVAQRLVLQSIDPIGNSDQSDLRSALGRVTAHEIRAPLDVPLRDTAAMDGYALRSSELHGPDGQGECSFDVAGRALAGRPYKDSVPPGAAVRVMTGAMVPAELDMVVMQEMVQREGDRIRVSIAARPGLNVRRQGEDLRAGRVAVEAGQILRPAHLALLASLGLGQIDVTSTPRVAFFSTGDELRPLGMPLSLGQIYDSNRYALHGMLTRLGVNLIDMGIVPDNPIALEAALRSASDRADLIISSGGVSVGDSDYTAEVMSRLGEVLFWKIAMRPGKPLAFGRIGQAYYFGLPGNPVAAMMSFYFLVRPALYKLMGAGDAAEPLAWRVPTCAAIRKRRGRTEFVRAALRPLPAGGHEVEPFDEQGAASIISLAQANCVVVLEHERGDVAAGETVEVIPFEGLI